MASEGQRVRCVNCRVEIVVPPTYSHGDHIKCGACGTKHKVARGDTLRLVLADVGPLKDALQANELIIERLEAELYAARASYGVGVNGVGIGVAYLLWQVGLEGKMLNQELFVKALGVAVLAGVVLELANYLFLAKRQKLRRLAGEIEGARQDSRALEQKIREASRV